MRDSKKNECLLHAKQQTELGMQEDKVTALQEHKDPEPCPD